MQAIVFDWDGTIADTLPHMYAATEEVVAGFGLAITWDDYCRLWTPDWRTLYRAFGLPEDLIEEAGRRWWAVYRGRDEAELLPGAADALKRLHRAGYPARARHGRPPRQRRAARSAVTGSTSSCRSASTATTWRR